MEEKNKPAPPLLPRQPLTLNVSHFFSTVPTLNILLLSKVAPRV